jgi:hypothetical protein
MTSPGAGSKDATAYLVKIIAVRTAIRMACWILETKKGEKRLRGEDQCFPTIRIEERTKSTARNKILKIRIPVMIRLILTGLVGSAGFCAVPRTTRAQIFETNTARLANTLPRGRSSCRWTSFFPNHRFSADRAASLGRKPRVKRHKRQNSMNYETNASLTWNLRLRRSRDKQKGCSRRRSAIVILGNIHFSTRRGLPHD